MSQTRRRLLIPEVVQTSAMDCGPASLKCLLEGFGIPVSYGRLREACQTSLDGTSIDTIEEAAVQLGLDAEQIMVPVDHVLLPEARALPAIAVVRLPNRAAHFVVVWSRLGRFVQVMDPATGRRWPTTRRFLGELYVHRMAVPAGGWREWAVSEDFLGPLRRRLELVGVAPDTRERLIERALADAAWRSLASVDAATRLVDALVRAGGLKAGPEAARVVERFFELAREERAAEKQPIPPSYWSVQPAPPGADAGEKLLLRGAVLIRARGRRASAPKGRGAAAGPESGTPSLSPELVAALSEAPARPARELLRQLRAEGWLAPAALVGAFLLAAVGVVFEALLFRGLFDVGRDLGLVGQRVGAMGALLVFATAMLLLELPIARGVLRLGRRLECRLRMAFLDKIPRLGDRYFRSRLTSDMAERSHSLHLLRSMPELGSELFRSTFELGLTTAGIVWLAPASAPLAIPVAAVAVALPLLAQATLAERDLRVRSHLGALSRFYLDALLGLVPVRVHGAERPVRREHEGLLEEWLHAGDTLQRAVVVVEAVQLLAGFGLSAWLLLGQIARAGDVGSALLLVYWVLNLPTLGLEIALIARQVPIARNVTLRLLEPLAAPADESPPPVVRGSGVLGRQASTGVAIAIEGVTVRAAGHTILEDITLDVKSGSHVAIVGVSGAGKTSLVSLLLGWHRPAAGRVLVDGVPLDAARLEELRRETAWVDPTVQLWNRSLAYNLTYGASDGVPPAIGWVIEQADLRAMLERLPEGLQTPLGEGGGLVSGGEGQRVRLGRAMSRAAARLVILDEPFRGLERERRRELLARARRLWAGATLLCITHDVGETRLFERVVVVEGGRVVEDDAPGALIERPKSRYTALLDAEEAVREGLWAAAAWRRLRLDGGRLIDIGRNTVSG